MVLVVKNLPANAGDIRNIGSTPGWGRFLRGGNGNTLQYSCLENPMNRGAWCVGLQRVGHDWSDLAWNIIQPEPIRTHEALLAMSRKASFFSWSCCLLQLKRPNRKLLFNYKVCYRNIFLSFNALQIVLFYSNNVPMKTQRLYLRKQIFNAYSLL